MKTLTATEVARNSSSVVNGVEADQEEIVLMRNHKPVARLVPGSRAQNALEVLGDFYHTLDDDTADALSDAVNFGKEAKRGTLNELRNPWAF